MGFNRNKAKSINPTKMVNYRKTGNAMNVAINSTTKNIFVPYVITGGLGEDVDISTNSFLASFNPEDGLWYKSTALKSDNLPACGVFVQSGSTGDTVNIQQFDEIALNGADFDLTKPVYLDNGTPNFSQDLLTDPTSAKDLRQYIGFPISDNHIILNISEPKILY